MEALKLELLKKEKVSDKSLLDRWKDLLDKQSTESYKYKVKYLFEGFPVDVAWWHKGTKNRFSLQRANLFINAVYSLGLFQFIDAEQKGQQVSWTLKKEVIEFLKNN